MDDPPLTQSEKDSFKGIVDGLGDDTASKVLAHYQAQVQMWLRRCDRNGYTPTTSDLVRLLMATRTSRGRLVVALAAALFKLAHQEEDRNHA